MSRDPRMDISTQSTLNQSIMLKNLDQNALAEEILQLYLDNKIDRRNSFRYLIPKLSELKEFAGNIRRTQRP